MGEMRRITKMVPVELYDDLMTMLDKQIYMNATYYKPIYLAIKNNKGKLTLGQLQRKLRSEGISPRLETMKEIAELFNFPYTL